MMHKRTRDLIEIFVFGVLLALSVWVIFSTEFKNPEMTDAQLMANFWPRYLVIAALLGVLAVYIRIRKL
jgi:hypothetical protein